MSASPVKFGLIGYGLFGKHHANAIANTKGAELAGIAVKTEASQAAAREAFPDVRIYSDYRRLIEHHDIEVVDIVVPNQMHYEVARDVIKRGKHVLLEKPMAVELAHCDELLELADKHNVTISINHELRLSSLWGQVKSLIDEGRIGRVQYVLIELSRFPYRQGSEGWRYDASRVGNWILEEPIHFFDLARWYMSGCGDPVSIYARANSRQPEHPELRDNFSAFVNYPEGEYAVISQTLSAFEHHVVGKIVGVAGAIWAHWSAPDARSERPTYGLRYGLGDNIHEVPIEKPTGELLELADQIQAMVATIRSGAAPPCNGLDGHWSTRLCLAAEESVVKGEIVNL